MNLVDISEKALVFSPDETVSKVASRMYREHRTEALVFDRDKYIGMFTARDLVKRRINDPDKVKLANLKAIIKKIKPFGPRSDPPEIIQYILINGYSSVPFREGKTFSIITKLGLLRLLPKEVYKGRRASQVATYPFCVSLGDSIAVAKSMIRQMRLFRLVIVDEKSRADGIVDTLDLLSTIVDKHQASRGELAGNAIKLEEVLASSPRIKQSHFITVAPETGLGEVVERMVKQGEPVAIVQDEKLEGMITPADILALQAPAQEGVLVKITGQQQEDPFIKTVIDEELTHFASKIGKMLPIQDITVDIDRKESDGKRVKYSVKAKLITERGMFFAHDFAWDVTKALRGVIHKLEREVEKKLGKQRVFGRASGSIT